MTKYIFTFFLLTFCAFPVFAESDPSLIDLFGEEESKQTNKEQEKQNSSQQIAAENNKGNDKVEVDDDGVFSFLNFSFLRKFPETLKRSPFFFSFLVCCNSSNL